MLHGSLEERGALNSRSNTFSADTEADHAMNSQRVFKECKAVPLLCKNQLTVVFIEQQGKSFLFNVFLEMRPSAS